MLEADPQYDEYATMMVKTHLSLTHDPTLKGVPKGWTLPIRDVLIYSGSKFLCPCAGAISLMPGTSSDPAFKRVDVDTKTSVASMLGNPTMKPTFDDENWYYYSKKTEQWAFFKERDTEMDILAISFDAENYVSGIRRYSVADNQLVNTMGKKTVTHGKDVNFFEELFGNVGRFGATGSNPEAGY
jgi:hypothetical protein